MARRVLTDMDTPNKKALIYQTILRRLLTRQYRFGERISVKELSQETGVSRQPIMSALMSLQERGFVHITAQVGCEVMAPTPDEVGDFYQMFASLEGLIVRLATQRGGADGVARLRQINAQFAQTSSQEPDTAGSFLPINWAFHKHLHQMAGSALVCARQVANMELSDFFIVQTCGFGPRLDHVALEHDEVIDAMASGDAERAYRAAVAHILSVADNVVNHMREAQATA